MFFRGYPIYAVSDYASGQQYYTHTNNFNASTPTNGHTSQYVAVEDSVISSRESPHADPIVNIFFF